ncbi:MAG TPA: RsmE family RNA methyltransferase [Cyclobacteriaceae bacterium]|nr:RsmE family RNA methyltransferase [Cyclobacteriaceae bacterium]
MEIRDEEIILPEDESSHCTRVLRLKKGDEAGVFDGNGNFYRCRISETGSKHALLKIIETEHSDPDPWHIHVALAPTKNMNRIEWFAEKATELGIHELSFLLCSRSERKSMNPGRLNKIVIGALKQSKSKYLPVINPMKDFEKFLVENQSARNKYICHISDIPKEHLHEIARPGGDYLLLIGPEGDFDRQEISMAKKLGFLEVSLGRNILRTETAALAGLHILSLINQKGT